MDREIYPLMRDAEERHWWFRGRRAVIEALLERARPAPGTRVLDAGCGTGRNLELLARIGPAAGVDPEPQAVEFCRARGLPDVLRADVTELPFEDGRFGLIAATDVLEHVADDRSALRELRRVAGDGATLLLTVPAYAWLWSAEDERLAHHRRYTLTRLRSTARETGWEPRFGTYFNLILLPPIAAARLVSSREGARPELDRTPRRLDGPLSLPMRAEARLIRAGVRLPAGVSVGLLCRAA